MMKIHSIDNGFCRVNYVKKNNQNQLIHCCIQDDGRGGGVNVYRQTKDGEPQNKIIPVRYDIFQIPTGDSAIEIIVRDFLEAKL